MTPEMARTGTPGRAPAGPPKPRHRAVRLLAALPAMLVAGTGSAAAAVPASAPATAADVTMRQAAPPLWQTSPYVYAPEGAGVPEPEWDRSYMLGIDRAKQVGLPYFFFQVQWDTVQLPDGTMDLSGLDQVVTYAHQDGVRPVIDLTTCDASGPQPPTLTGGGYRQNSKQPGSNSCPPKNIDAAIPAWTAIARRYRPHGDLAAALGWPAADDFGVLDYEIENEPDLDPAVQGNWAATPKDYALFLSHLSPAMKAVDGDIRLLAPALSQKNADPDTSVQFLDRVLSTDPATMDDASDDYRAAVAAGEPIIGGGPWIDFYSYHEDFADPGSGVVTVRPHDLRALIAKYTQQARYPTSARPQLWCTECNVAYSSGKDTTSQLSWTWAESQYLWEALGSGDAHVMADFNLNNQDDAATFSSEPGVPMMHTMVTYFPTAAGWSDSSAAATAAAGGQKVVSYTWTDPVTGARSMALWAPDIPSSSGSNTPVSGAVNTQSGPPFTVRLPVRTRNALVIDSSWVAHPTAATGGSVSLTLHPAQPSPVTVVVEQPDATAGSGAGGAGSLGPSGLPDTGAAPRAAAGPAGAAGGIVCGVLALAGVVRRRGRRAR